MAFEFSFRQEYSHSLNKRENIISIVTVIEFQLVKHIF